MTDQPLPADLKLGYVHLAVANLDSSIQFYQHSLGFKLHRREADAAYLGAGGKDLLVLTTQTDPASKPVRSTGLYHFAILVPTRLELARVLNNLIATQAEVTGFADHAVSEAIYLDDNEGNGIEIYWDRPRTAWYDQKGNFLLTTLPLDLQSVLNELEGQSKEWSGLAEGTILGHMHLKVGTLSEANHFYCEVLGFDVMARMPGALFISAGGYHHHLGLNIWESAGARPAPDNAPGLRGFTIMLPDQKALAQLRARIQEAGIHIEDEEGSFVVFDPFRNGVRVEVKA